MGFKLGKRSLSNLEGVHPDLVKVVKKAQLLKEKKTTTMNSRHLTGHAVDLAAWVIPEGSDKGTVSWDWKHYYIIEKAMKQAATELKIPIEWGGDWKTFKDAPHWQLPFNKYPK